jgi:hypothetical protein
LGCYLTLPIWVKKEPTMRKSILAIAFALAVAGAGFVAGSMLDPRPAEAGCTSRC